MDLAINLNRSSKVPLYQQLTAEIRSAVLEGRLKPKQKLPSSRSLAKSLTLSRSTVTQSYEQLESEGYLETLCGSGTYICHQLTDEWLDLPPTELANKPQNKDLTLSQFGQSLISINRLQVSEPDDEISFRYGNPAISYFPIQQWRKLLNRHCNNSAALLNYADESGGYFPLKVEIADYLGRSRAVRCTPEQVIIVNGSQQALDLIARLTLNPGDWVAIEEPGYLGARCCFRGQSANLEPIPVNEDGLNLEFLTQCDKPIGMASLRDFKLIYVTPSHQFPTGLTLSLQQRIALLQWAQDTGTLIIEDDYDSEYRYGEQPVPALQGMDKNQSVIYIGTFSKTMFPSLRIGYLIVPPHWVSIVNKAKWLCDRSVPLLEQYALTDWIREGDFEQHIRRMRKLYNSRRQALIRALEKYFGDRVKIIGANAGIHVMAKIKTGWSDRIAIEKAAAVGIGLISAKEYYLNPCHQGEFIFGYGQLEEMQIETGILRLSQVLNIKRSL